MHNSHLITTSPPRKRLMKVHPQTFISHINKTPTPMKQTTDFLPPITQTNTPWAFPVWSTGPLQAQRRLTRLSFHSKKKKLPQAGRSHYHYLLPRELGLANPKNPYGVDHQRRPRGLPAAP